MNTLAFGFGSFGTMDMIIIMTIALLLFGKRLPEVGKSLGKGIIEFKKGLKGVEDDVSAGGEPREAYRPPLPPREADNRLPLPAADYDDRRVSQGSRPERDEYRQPMTDPRTAPSDYRGAPAQDYRPTSDYRPRDQGSYDDRGR